MVDLQENSKDIKWKIDKNIYGVSLCEYAQKWSGAFKWPYPMCPPDKW